MLVIKLAFAIVEGFLQNTRIYLASCLVIRANVGFNAFINCHLMYFLTAIPFWFAISSVLV